MDGWHKAIGKVVYDPWRGDMKNKTNWWCVLEVDKEITRYYRYWIDKTILNPMNINNDGQKKELAQKYAVEKLCEPSWDAHISILRGEKPEPHLMHLWKKYDGKRVEFQYKHHPRRSGDTTFDRPENFWFVEVQCPELMLIRKELMRPTHWSLHLTVGRTYD